MPKALKALAARRGYGLDLYMGAMDVFEAEICEPESGLYRFKPDVTFLVLSSQKIKEQLYASDDRRAYVEGLKGRLKLLWEQYAARSDARLVQLNLVRPRECVFGHYEQKEPESVGAIFSSLNAFLVEEARRCPDLLLCDVDHLAADRGYANWFDDRLWWMARTFCSLESLPVLAFQILDICLAALGQMTKAVVLDLDGVLWGGSIGEREVADLELGFHDEGAAYRALQFFFLELKRRGLLLAAVSKNDPETARRPFREHPFMALKEEDFAVFIANWENKAENIKRVQKRLNIGFDSMVFIDDSAFERRLVRHLIPQIVVPEMPEDPSLYLSFLAGLNLFETAEPGKEGERRTRFFQEETKREETQASFSDVDAYLADLGMEAKVERLNEGNLARVLELSSRSHQFNLTSRRYGREAYAALMRDVQTIPLTFTLKDRFGAYGLVAASILKVEGETAVLDESFMSCRVFQRGLEAFMMNKLVALSQKAGAKFLIGLFRRTDKNRRFETFFSLYGFEKETEERWKLDLASYRPQPTHIKEETDET